MGSLPTQGNPRGHLFYFFFLNDSNYLIAHWIVVFGESNDIIMDISFLRLFHELGMVTFIHSLYWTRLVDQPVGN